ncbi:MAG: DUF1573 domain-containing protein [Crocinitomicaceae bacterium]|nr:DUF1573 domain-containing protein [Crocinitomicaceae bacterium]
MKNLLIAMIVLASGTLFGQQNVTAFQNGAQMEFDKDVHDYGTIQKGANGDCVFIIKNTGNQPLVIRDAKGSCQCTVPEWPKDPIAPGKSAEIKVKYNTTRVGVINKSVTITSNATNGTTKVLKIQGTVVE